MIRWVLLLALWLGGCVHALGPTMVPGEIHTYRTDDGWVNNLRRYPGEGPAVFLVHGIGVNHTNWDFRPEVSLASALQDEGWDVWVVELRGDPGSLAPERRLRNRYTFDDYAERDLPAAVRRVEELTGQDGLYWVGHSLGGMLMYATLSQEPDMVRAGVAVSSPVTFDTPLGIHKALKHLGWMVGEHGRLPARSALKFAVGIGMAPALEKRAASKDSMSRPMLRGLVNHTVEPVSMMLAKQGVSWMKDGAFNCLDGTCWVEPVDVPMLVMGGPLDGIVSEPDVAEACDVYPDCTYIRLDRASGFSRDYGHVDPLFGRDASEEVWPLILDFLAAQRADFEAREAALSTTASVNPAPDLRSTPAAP